MYSKKHPSSKLFLLFSALAGFILALSYYYFYPKSSFFQDSPDPDSVPENSSQQFSYSAALQSSQFTRPLQNNAMKLSFVNSFAPAVNLAAPAVVNIFTRKRIKQQDNIYNNSAMQAILENRPPPPLYKEESDLGSGVIVSSKGHILTNNHVISDAEDIEVLLKDGRYFQASIVGRDLETDLALLKVSAKNLPIIYFGDSSALQVGDIVLAIGNPFGLGHTVTSGIISALNRSQFRANSFDNFIQTDAAINPGNSGGALVNTQGEMIGLNTINISNSGGSQGIGFAIPAALAKKVMYQLINYGEVSRGWIGFEAREITPMLAQQLKTDIQHGLFIVGIVEKGPGFKAGLQPGDMITHIDDKEINSAKTALKFITELHPGNTAILRGVRKGEIMEFKVIAEKRPQKTDL